MQFDRYQQQWQQQSAPEVQLDRNHDSLMARIRKNQRRTVFGNLFMSISFAATFIGLGLMWRNQAGQSVWMDVGMLLIFLDMLGAMIFMWSLVIRWTNRNVSLGSLEFVQSTITKLRRQKFITYLILPVYLLILNLGINMTYVFSMQASSYEARLSAHLSVGILLLLAIPISLFVSYRKHRRLTDPMIEELRAVETELIEDKTWPQT
ncbi:MAG: hypothetical protein AAF206_24925 [Bacteroidota bacterium]